MPERRDRDPDGRAPAMPTDGGRRSAVLIHVAGTDLATLRELLPDLLTLDEARANVTEIDWAAKLQLLRAYQAKGDLELDDPERFTESTPYNPSSPYSASKAAVEAIGNTFRQEIKPTGAKVGVAYYSELATDMTSRGFDTVAGKKLTGGGTVSGVAPVEAGLRALERGIAKRSRRIAAPGWVPPVVPLRHVAQRVIELKPMPDLEESLEIARTEQVDYTTEQPTGTTRALGS